MEALTVIALLFGWVFLVFGLGALMFRIMEGKWP